MATSAGLLLFRGEGAGLEVLLVHPGGPYWRKRDAGTWSIPKGGIAAGEDPLDAARREFEEETGAPAGGKAWPLTPVRQGGGKLVLAWALRGDFDPTTLLSNTFEMEWPPRSGRKASFPEVDRAEWFHVGEARRRLLAGQRPLLDELERRLAVGASQRR
jgi:predicted NUDIX family NTP pyrophosphohydrolase